MKEIVNSKIKFREPFRPFAPVIIENELENFFEIKNPDQYPLRFMLFVLAIKLAHSECPLLLTALALNVYSVSGLKFSNSNSLSLMSVYNMPSNSSS